MTEDRIYHLNDRTRKYIQMAQAARNHKYLGLPGEYICLYPTEYVLPNMETGRADDIHSSSANMLINVEEESGNVSQKTLKKISKYRIFGDFMYPMGTYTAIICVKDPKNFPKEYEITPTNILRPNYIYFSPEELWMKYENLINKIEQKEQLSDMEALDIAFVPKYMPPNHRASVTEKMAKLYKKAKITDKRLKNDVGAILGGMILKNIPLEKQYKLLVAIDMKQIENDLQRLVYDEYGDELEEKDKKIEEKDEEIKNIKTTTKQKDKKIKEGLKKLLKTTNDPKIQQEITSMLLLL